MIDAKLANTILPQIGTGSLTRKVESRPLGAVTLRVRSGGDFWFDFA
jgi:hypothetical protein